MKILMVSIPSLHFFRWVSQLEDSGHDVYWFDITGMSNHVSRISWVNQKTNWKLKKDFYGRIFVKNKLPKLYHFFNKINENKTAKVFENLLEEIKPDIVHSFALYLTCTPIIEVMEQNPSIKWVYSSWGSDLFYFQNDLKYLIDIKRVLPRVNYLFTDCERDYKIAINYGFKGEFLGVFPGGGGFELEKMEKFKMPICKRKTILIKGYQGRSGRAISVLKAVETIKDELLGYNIKVFGSDREVFDYVFNSPLHYWENFHVIGKLSHEKVFEMMGEALIYIGNSNSDGIPNSLLEAICMNAFPIQSNPGGVTSEIINDKVNGILIEDCESESEIALKILYALKNINFEAIEKCNKEFVNSLRYNELKEKVKRKYIYIISK